MIIATYAVAGTPLVGHFTDALGVADALGDKSSVLGALFAIVLLDASIIGAAAVTLATSYAFGDMFGVKHSLHRSFRDAKAFYASYTGLVVAAAAIVLIPNAPLGLVTEAVQALAGLLLPSASVFLLLLCNDPEVLGPWVNPRWLNALATFIIATLLMLSGTLMATTLFPHLDAATHRDLAVHRPGRRAGRGRRHAAAAPEPGAPPPPRPAARVPREHARQLADAAAGPAQTRHLVTRAQARHARPARLPRHRRAAPAHQGHPARHPLRPPRPGRSAPGTAGRWRARPTGVTRVGGEHRARVLCLAQNAAAGVVAVSVSMIAGSGHVRASLWAEQHVERCGQSDGDRGGGDEADSFEAGDGMFLAVETGDGGGDSDDGGAGDLLHDQVHAVALHGEVCFQGGGDQVTQGSVPLWRVARGRRRW